MKNEIEIYRGINIEYSEPFQEYTRKFIKENPTFKKDLLEYLKEFILIFESKLPDKIFLNEIYMIDCMMIDVLNIEVFIVKFKIVDKTLQYISTAKASQLYQKQVEPLFLKFISDMRENISFLSEDTKTQFKNKIEKQFKEIEEFIKK